MNFVVSVSLIRRPKLPGLGISAARRKADAAKGSFGSNSHIECQFESELMQIKANHLSLK
jgi:hypothetical protein